MNRYQQIKTQLTTRYEGRYLTHRTSFVLAENIQDLTLSDIIDILETIKVQKELRDESKSLSRKSDLFDKLILMKGISPNDWVLRLHIYNAMKPSERPGYVISNLNREIRDDENHIHEHSWQLASRVLLGGLINHQYEKDPQQKITEAVRHHRYHLVATSKDGVSPNRNSRKAIFEKDMLIAKKTADLYLQGDLVHYPIEIPHKVDLKACKYLGMTMTLAHTSARMTDCSIFYEEEGYTSDHELDVEAHAYTDNEFLEAINLAVTTLKLMKLCDELATKGFDRYNRFVDPSTAQKIPNNVLETELLPTIAMIRLQSDIDSFIETPMKEELTNKSVEEIAQIKARYAELGPILKSIIQNTIHQIDDSSLNKLIEKSQINLLNQLSRACPQFKAIN